jgi:hypothetical protein
LNALALARFAGFRLIHGGGRDGIGLLLIGSVAVGAAIWAISRSGRSEPAKN